MPRFRSYRGSRSRVTRPPIVSFKKVLNIASASESAGKIDFILVSGLDGIANKQTTAVDNEVPVGAKIEKIDIWLNYASFANVAVFVNWSIQLTHKGQATIDPVVIGGDDQRNQVFLQGVRSVGLNQNSDIKIAFKIPKKFQRVRAGDFWVFTSNASNVMTSQKMAIYKFYT